MNQSSRSASDSDVVQSAHDNSPDPPVRRRLSSINLLLNSNEKLNADMMFALKLSGSQREQKELVFEEDSFINTVEVTPAFDVNIG